MEEIGFLNRIKTSFGTSVMKLLKEFMNLNSKLANYKTRKLFLIKCRKFGIFPTHIINNFKCLITNLEPNMPFCNKIRKLEEDFKRRILNIEIQITFWKISTFNNSLTSLKEKLTAANLPMDILEDFYRTQSKTFSNLFNSNLLLVNKKFDSLKQHHYKKFDISNTNWCCNISGTIVPENVIKILALGPKFGLPYFSIKDIPAFKILAESESIIQNISNSHEQDIARFQISNTIYNFLNHNFHLNMKEKFIQNSFLETKHFLRNNPNLIIIKSDKGNRSVIMSRNDYDDRLNSLICDQNTYQLVNKDPTLSFQNKNNDFIKTLYNIKAIDEKTKKDLTTYKSIAPKFYGLPKVHKSNYPLRPIVSFINAPTYKTSKFLANCLKFLIADTYNVKNSYEFVNFIKTQTIPENFVLISLDVVSLFTNIKIDLAIKIIDEKFELLQPHTNIPKVHFIKLLTFCLKSGYFSLNKKFYKQLDGIAMGSPLSPIIANIIMEALLDSILGSIDFVILFVKLYVDDLLLCIPKDKISEILSIFNNNLFGLEFTLEIEDNNEISFLDTLLVKKPDGKILSTLYSKTCSSGRILNFHSIHPTSQIINTAYGFVYRVMKITTDKDFDTKSFIFKYLLANKFPKFLISKLISRYENNNNVNSFIDLNSSIATFLPFKSLHYVKGLSEMLTNILNKFDINCKITYSVSNTLNKIFSKLKDKTSDLLRYNIVYKIHCKNCDLIYIGTTGQLLKNRLSGHKSDIKPPIRNSQASTLCQHSYNTGHYFDFDGTKILDVENKYFNRMFLEMVHINANYKLSVNKRSDTDDLSKVYSGLIDYIFKL